MDSVIRDQVGFGVFTSTNGDTERSRQGKGKTLKAFRSLRVILSTTLLAFLLVIMGNGLTMATPGGLDSRGGHHCWTNCRSYGKYKGEYHCHQDPCGRRDIRRHRQHGH